MRTPRVAFAAGVVIFFAPAASQAQQARHPCGEDGRGCECQAGEWQWSYVDYYATNYEAPRVEGRKTYYPSCDTRVECAEEYRAFVTRERSDAEYSQTRAAENLESARRFQREGDQHWYDVAMGNHRWALAEAEASRLRAEHAVGPHCDLDKVAERLEAEFAPPADEVAFVEPRVTPRNQIGVTTGPVSLRGTPGPVQLSDRSREALNEMRENWERAGVLSAGVELLPEVLVGGTIASAPTEPPGIELLVAAVAAGTFPWKAWWPAREALNARLDGFVRARNRDICLIEVLYWSQPGRARSGAGERAFWTSFCRGM